MSESKGATPEQKDGWIEMFLGVDLAQLRAKAPPPPPDAPAPPVQSRAKPAPPAQAAARLGKAGSDGAGVALAKSALLWDRTRKDLAEQIAAMQQEILERAAGEIDFEAIKAGLPVLEEVLEQLDASLSAKLNQIYGTPDKAERERLRAEAKNIAVEHQAYMAATPLMGALDGNPFITSFNGVAHVRAALQAIVSYL